SRGGNVRAFSPLLRGLDWCSRFACAPCLQESGEGDGQLANRCCGILFGEEEAVHRLIAAGHHDHPEDDFEAIQLGLVVFYMLDKILREILGCHYARALEIAAIDK